MLAGVVGGLAFLTFSFVPWVAGGYLSQVLSAVGGPSVAGMTSALINPTLPAVGLAAAVLVFLGLMVRGTKLYGPMVLVSGLAFSVYVYVAFHGGSINIAIPQGLGHSASGSVSIDVAMVMYLFLLGPALTVLKGVALMVMKDSRLELTAP